MRQPAYPAARAAATAVEAHFVGHFAAARDAGRPSLAPRPDARTIEAVIDAAFWASLRREEGHPPKISLAYLPPGRAGSALIFEQPLPLAPAGLAKLAPAVERPGVHLGVWRYGEELRVWGATRAIPALCMVLEVVEPGLLVVKHQRGEEAGKFANVAVLQGDHLKLVDSSGGEPGAPALARELLGLGERAAGTEVLNILLQLAASMRAHGRGGSLLVVPAQCDGWRESIVHPVAYAVAPPFDGLSRLMRSDVEQRGQSAWRDRLQHAVEGVAGLTAVDGATLLSDRYDVLAFGAKIGRREGSAPVERLLLTEPVVGESAAVVHPAQIGGTRHLSAAQFVHDQRDALALVASQDGRFTAFAWSEPRAVVHAHRMEMYLL